MCLKKSMSSATSENGWPSRSARARLRPEAVGYCPAIEKSGERVPECLPLEEIAVGGHPLKLLLQALVGLAAALAHSPQGRRRRRSRRRECRFDLRKDEGRVLAEGR